MFEWREIAPEPTERYSIYVSISLVMDCLCLTSPQHFSVTTIFSDFWRFVYSVSRAKEYTICIHIALLYMYIHVCVEQIHVRNCVCCISLVRIWNNYICFCNRRNARRLIQNDHLIMRLFSYPRDLVINKNINLLYVIYRLNKKHKSSNR